MLDKKNSTEPFLLIIKKAAFLKNIFISIREVFSHLTLITEKKNMRCLIWDD